MTDTTRPTASKPITARPALLDLAHRADTLAAFLRDRGLRAEALAAENIAAALRVLGPLGYRLMAIVLFGTDCCTLCGWRTVRP